MYEYVCMCTSIYVCVCKRLQKYAAVFICKQALSMRAASRANFLLSNFQQQRQLVVVCLQFLFAVRWRYSYFICDNIFASTLLLLLALLFAFAAHHSLIAHSPIFSSLFLLFQSVKRRTAYAYEYVLSAFWSPCLFVVRPHSTCT